VLDDPRVFDDPFAVRFLRQEDADELKQPRPARGSAFARGMRMALAVRSRIAEDALCEAVARGVRQYVVLGAGFDTFALRSPYPADVLRVFEVDHPDTQAAKRAALDKAGLRVPEALTMVAVDFTSQSLDERLAACGFRAGEPAFFAFLGVCVYLEREAVVDTLKFIAGHCAKGSEVVFDYVVTPSRLPFWDRLLLRLAAARVARLGEPWKTFLDPQGLPPLLASLGFARSEAIGAAAIAERIRQSLPFEPPGPPPRFRIGGLARAWV
jgi:methyltransferase (TIGR00027 family)